MNVLGIIFSYSDRENLRELTKNRTLASVPFAGKYRIIDFVLSNYVNSDIFDVSIITRNNYHSLVDHLGSGKEWDMTRKIGGLRILSPHSSPGAAATGYYRGSVDALYQNMHSIKRSRADYVIVSGSSIICNINYEELLKKHIERNADVTCVYTNLPEGKTLVPLGMPIFKIDENEKIYDLCFSNGDKKCKGITWGIGIYVIKKSLLESLVADAVSFGRYDFYRDILQKLMGNLSIKGYEYKKQILEISSIASYMKANMSLLSEDVRKKTFEMPVYTKIKDSVPVHYYTGCEIRNSFIADGCTIEGTVVNSVISRGVRIGKGSTVKDCIIMQNTEIQSNVHLEYAILDKDVIVRENRQLAGHEAYPVVIEKLSIV